MYIFNSFNLLLLSALVVRSTPLDQSIIISGMDGIDVNKDSSNTISVMSLFENEVTMDNMSAKELSFNFFSLLLKTNKIDSFDFSPLNTFTNIIGDTDTIMMKFNKPETQLPEPNPIVQQSQSFCLENPETGFVFVSEDNTISFSYDNHQGHVQFAQVVLLHGKMKIENFAVVLNHATEHTVQLSDNFISAYYNLISIYLEEMVTNLNSAAEIRVDLISPKNCILARMSTEL